MSYQMQRVRAENIELEKIIQNYIQQIEKQRQTNLQHENEIESLLKFNQRLLYIIENQIADRKDNGSLMPISERSERESDMMNPLNSLIKTKVTVARSERGGTRSVKNQKPSYQSRLQALGKNLQTSTFLRSQDQQSFMYSQNKSTCNNNNSKPQTILFAKQSNQAIHKMQKQIQSSMSGFYNCAQKNKYFYDKKISELQNLSKKIGSFDPESKFTQISRKVQLSEATATLVKKAMMKSSSSTSTTEKQTISIFNPSPIQPKISQKPQSKVYY